MRSQKFLSQSCKKFPQNAKRSFHEETTFINRKLTAGFRLSLITSVLHLKIRKLNFFSRNSVWERSVLEINSIKCALINDEISREDFNYSRVIHVQSFFLFSISNLTRKLPHFRLIQKSSGQHRASGPSCLWWITLIARHRSAVSCNS